VPLHLLQIGYGGHPAVAARVAVDSTFLSWLAACPSCLQAYSPAAFTAGLTAGQRRQLVVWLSVCSGWVFVLVVIGGITRLTRSGLSMTSWKFTGEAPPSSPASAVWLL
jgi:cytochrome c oxidase assembly protein subunit 15